jgi:hypothetical protein
MGFFADTSSSSESSPVAQPGRRHFWRSIKRRFGRRRSEEDSEASTSDSSPATQESPPCTRSGVPNSAPDAVAPPSRLSSTSRSDELAEDEIRPSVKHRPGRFSRWRSAKAAGHSASSPGSRLQNTGLQKTTGRVNINPAAQASAARNSDGGKGAQSTVPLHTPDEEQAPPSAGTSGPDSDARVQSQSERPALSNPPQASSSQVRGPASPLWLLEEAPVSILSYPPARCMTDRRPMLAGGEDPPPGMAPSLTEESRRAPPPRPSTPGTHSSSPSNYSSRDSSPSVRPQGGGIGPLFRGRKSQRQIERMSWNGWDRELLSTWENDSSSPERPAGGGREQGASGGGGVYSSADSGLTRLQQGGEDRDGSGRQIEQRAAGGWFDKLTDDSRVHRVDCAITHGTAPLTARRGPLGQQAPTRQVRPL